MFDDLDLFNQVDLEGLGADLAVDDRDLPEGGDLAVEELDLAENNGLTYYDQSVNRRLSTPKGSLEIYADDPVQGLVALDGEYGSDYYQTISEPSSSHLFDTIRQNFLDAILSDPMVAEADVQYYVNEDGEVIFEITHAPLYGDTTLQQFRFVNGELAPIV